VGSEKRERQRAARLEKAEAQATAAKRHRTRRSFVRIAVAALVVLAVLFGVSVLMGDDDDDSGASETSDTTEATDETTDSTDADGVDGSDGSGEFAYGTTPCPPADGADSPTLTFDDAFEQCIDPSKTYTATFATSEGDVVVELDTERTPGTTNNFVALARHGYYDGTRLFRTDPSIGIIQGGSPHSNDPSDEGPGYSLPDEGGVFDFSDAAGGGTGPFTYAPGQLIMARSAGPDGAGAQFFFSVDENVTALDNQGTYVVFGKVTRGLDVLQAIMGLHQADPQSQLGGGPSRPVTIESVTIAES
jgi:cyclophilin family peptidyl-prolyl cis-trans isomerase